MSLISLIAAIDEQGGLGQNNKLLCHLPADLQHFKKVTTGKPIIMGRKTYESIGRPLPNRTNIVISRSTHEIEGVEVFNSLAKAIEAHSEAVELMIIGGAEIFTQTMVLADRLYLTKIHHQFEADVFFPHIDEKNWRLTNTTYRAKDLSNEYDMTFQVFERV